ncbi:sensor histidine kinase [Enterocloster sp.]|uniref:sensor histidine kinase n=1 Tax=Enterocloster sp. TaxID=2719315 RepID=UPI003080C6C6
MLRNIWLTISIKKKIGIFAAMVILIMALLATFSICIMNFSLGGFNTILNDNSRCHDFQEALDLEIESFADYIRDATPDTRDQYVLSCVRTERCLRSLPFDYARIGTERYARTWSILNGYETYQAYRDELAETQVRESDFVERLYRVYKMQEYLQTYARRLVQVTLKEGNDSYQEKVPVFYNMPYLILAISAVFMGFVMFLTKILSNALVSPAVLLAQCARKIAKNDFTGEDPSVENRDEMGELVRAFNKMKRSTKGYIDTLKENHRMSELLHREEIERVEMEKQLSGARLELLKSQINPHFLFNTLNMIACMAKLEEAVTTERMISSMSSLFRYNLKTSEQIVTLARELKVVQDYMYIQQMRFGSRILYSCDLKVDAEQAMIPAFTLQPVVENAMVHGLSKKEQGGRVHVRIWEQGKRLVISVADTGLGMSEERLAEVTEAMKERRTSRIGIGLGNIYKRIHMMYKQGEFRIASIEGRGTVIQMFIPQEKHNRGDK